MSAATGTRMPTVRMKPLTMAIETTTASCPAFFTLAPKPGPLASTASMWRARWTVNVERLVWFSRKRSRPLGAIDLDSDFAQLLLDFEDVVDGLRLLEDRQVLRLDRPLRADSRVEIGVFLGDILTADLLASDPFGERTHRLQRAVKDRGRDTEDDGNRDELRAVVVACAARTRTHGIGSGAGISPTERT